jgi:hypothetical protein
MRFDLQFYGIGDVSVGLARGRVMVMVVLRLGPGLVAVASPPAGDDVADEQAEACALNFAARPGTRCAGWR